MAGAAADRVPDEPQPALSELQVLQRDNKTLTEQLQAAKADKYSQQGQVS